ncbi:hypothetical protein D3OALGA1CA_1723 [Olavius algarvensis associated proteobacterium Delta 3]|nr:hypothetical protein D3OALGA1CA_1723 [Olavius algarvensis associated proteobacterium Delta 3]CAB5126026.1 hypothetical protein D3OALGB2SA_3293 [Olavius algarvensis associated proteobacterium Delta 3]
MDFTIPAALKHDIQRFREFLDAHMTPHLSVWRRGGQVPLEFFHAMGGEGWFGFEERDGVLSPHSALREALIAEELGVVSPGVAIAVLAHMDLGFMGLYMFGSEALKKAYGGAALGGRKLMCVGNTENIAGSDVAGIATTAEESDGGWRLNGTKAYVTNGYIADLAVITAVTDPDASRTRRISMFLVDLNSDGVRRTKLGKQVWIPSDLTRLQFKDVFVPKDHILGEQGKGMQQVLSIFTRSRVPISALTLGTTRGAFESALTHAQKRRIFGRPIVEYQAKAFEAADFFARMEAARLMVWKACETADQGVDFRKEAAMAKYLTVEVAREVSMWAADLFGAVSVIIDHPIHKFPMDAWGSSLGEGTQDVQKLIIFREMMKGFS